MRALDARRARLGRRCCGLAYLNAAFETGIDNPLDAALVRAGQAAGLPRRPWTEGRRDPLRLRAPAPDHRRRAAACSRTRMPGGQGRLRGGAQPAAATGRRRRTPRPWRSTRRRVRGCASRLRRHGEQGVRVLALATRRVPARAHYGVQDEAAARAVRAAVLRRPAAARCRARPCARSRGWACA
jgi:Mg2+-importing ATPase